MSYDPHRYGVRSIDAGPLRFDYDLYLWAISSQLSDNRTAYTQTFAYDVLDRVTDASGKYGPEKFAYDLHGNRISVPEIGASYTYDPATLRLTNQNGIPFSYDPNGNLTGQPGRHR